MNPSQTNDWRELPRMQQILIFTICRLQQLKWMGFIEGGHVKPSAKAQAAFTQMLKEGFQPTLAETHEALDGIRAHCTRMQADADARLLAEQTQRESQEHPAP